MKKILRKIILPSIMAGSLLLPNCRIKDIPKKASEATTGEKDAYEEALDIHKNPAKYAEGITGKVLEEREKIGIEKYFLQREELEYLKLMTHHPPNSYMNIYGNPYITKEKEILDEIIGGGGLNINPMSVLSFGEANYKMYNYEGYSSTKLLVPVLAVRFLEFDSKKSLSEFLEERPWFNESKGNLTLKGTTKKGMHYSASTQEGNYFFSKNNIFINVDIPWMTWKEEEFFPEEKVASIDAFLHYDKRINAKLLTKYEDYRKGFREELKERKRMVLEQSP